MNLLNISFIGLQNSAKKWYTWIIINQFKLITD